MSSNAKSCNPNPILNTKTCQPTRKVKLVIQHKICYPTQKTFYPTRKRVYIVKTVLYSIQFKKVLLNAKSKTYFPARKRFLTQKRVFLRENVLSNAKTCNPSPTKKEIVICDIQLQEKRVIQIQCKNVFFYTKTCTRKRPIKL